MCQISRQSDNAFAFYSSFCKCAKRGRKIRRKKTKKLSQFLKSHISGMPEAISLKFGMWSTEVGGNVHSKICLVSSRQHRATEVRKLRFLSSCQYTHGVARRLLGPHDTLPCVLILHNKICLKSGYLSMFLTNSSRPSFHNDIRDLIKYQHTVQLTGNVACTHTTRMRCAVSRFAN